MDYADSLRRMADYLDERPDLAAKLSGKWDYPSESIWVHDWEDFQEIIKTLGGFEKGGYSGTLTASHEEKDEDDYTIFSINVNVSGVCEQKLKLDEDGQPVRRRKHVYVETDEWEDEVEYDCPTVWTS